MSVDLPDSPEFDQLAAELMLELDDERFDRQQAYWDARAMRHAPMSEGDNLALMMSPRNRARFDQAVAQARALFIVQAANANQPVAVAAASTGQRDVVRFDEEKLADFEIVLRPSGTTDWLVFCRLKREGFPLGSTLEIQDVVGRVWLSGVPDDEGQLVGLLRNVEDAREEARAGLTIFVDGVALSTAE